MFRRLLVVVFSVFVFFCFTNDAVAAESCSTSVTPNQIRTGRQATVTMTIANTGDVPLKWVHYYKGNESVTPIGELHIDGGWQIQEGDNATGNLNPGESVKVYFSVTAAGTNTNSDGWASQASQSESGSGAFTCDNSISIQISDTAPAPPIISAVSLQVGSTKSTINWTTDSLSNSVIEYGTSQGSLTNKKEDQNFVTSHSLEIDGLSTETTYYYQITSSTEGGDSTKSGVNTFTTGKLNSVTTTVTETVTNTVTNVVTQLKIVKIKDQTPPVISMVDLKGRVYLEAPEVSGEIEDDTAVSYLEYSLDGSSWTQLLPSKIGGKVATFRILPSVFDDGSYELQVRAYDASGNRSKVKSTRFVIDKFPPVVGPGIIYMGAMILYPDNDGVVNLISGQQVDVVLPESGGSDEVALTTAAQQFNLVKDLSTGLWRGKLSIVEPGLTKIYAIARDGAGNKTKRLWLTANVHERPRAVFEHDGIKKTLITVYSYDRDSFSFVKWGGQAYGQSNPVLADAKGEYSLILPPGRYYLEIAATGKRGIVSNVFDVVTTSPVLTEFKFDGLNLTLVDQFLSLIGVKDKVNVSISVDDQPTNDRFLGRLWSLAGIEGNGQSDLSKWLGKENWIQVSNTLLPDSSFEYLAFRDWLKGGRVMRFVGFQESFFRVKAFVDRGGYDVTPLADPQAALLSRIPMWTLPVNIFLDRTGKITRIKQGLINRDDLMDN